jgi:surfeit locus 1 family protein
LITGPRQSPPPRPRAAPSSARRKAGIGFALILFTAVFAIFIALGTWQLERRVWKLDLIARVEQRVHAAAVPAPVPVPSLVPTSGSAQWPRFDPAADEYRRVQATGVFLNDRETLVQASTDFGSGFWVLTPLRTEDGHIVLINRGFVSPERRDPAARGAPAPAGRITVTGLLRASEPGGGFLRHNDATAERWFSRDVDAIAAARGLHAAPYFIDADADSASDVSGNPDNPNTRRWPIGGLTVISFPNNHLVYAITWYVMALMTAVAAVATWRARREPPILREENGRGERDDGDSR